MKFKNSILFIVYYLLFSVQKFLSIINYNDDLILNYKYLLKIVYLLDAYKFEYICIYEFTIFNKYIYNLILKPSLIFIIDFFKI